MFYLSMRWTIKTLNKIEHGEIKDIFCKIVTDADIRQL